MRIENIGFEMAECARGGHERVNCICSAHDAIMYVLDASDGSAQVLCGHCREVVFPQAFLLRNLMIVCKGVKQEWRSVDLKYLVHCCGEIQPGMSHAQIEALTFSSEERATPGPHDG